MKWLLIGDSNVYNNAKTFLTKDHSVQKERKVVKCTTQKNFKLQVSPPGSLSSTFSRNFRQIRVENFLHFSKKRPLIGHVACATLYVMGHVPLPDGVM